MMPHTNADGCGDPPALRPKPSALLPSSNRHTNSSAVAPSGAHNPAAAGQQTAGGLTSPVGPMLCPPPHSAAVVRLVERDPNLLLWAYAPDGFDLRRVAVHLDDPWPLEDLLRSSATPLRPAQLSKLRQVIEAVDPAATAAGQGPARLALRSVRWVPSGTRAGAGLDLWAQRLSGPVAQAIERMWQSLPELERRDHVLSAKGGRSLLPLWDTGVAVAATVAGADGTWMYADNGPVDPRIMPLDPDRHDRSLLLQTMMAVSDTDRSGQLSPVESLRRRLERQLQLDGSQLQEADVSLHGLVLVPEMYRWVVLGHVDLSAVNVTADHLGQTQAAGRHGTLAVVPDEPHALVRCAADRAGSMDPLTRVATLLSARATLGPKVDTAASGVI